MNFVALDFETANDWRASICQVGIAHFGAGESPRKLSWMVDPETDFSSRNVAIHGIGPRHVDGAPLFPDIYEEFLKPALNDQIVVSHMPFDRVALESACDRYGLEMPRVEWLDSAALARRTWREISQRGYNLGNLAARLGIEFQHHDAGADAVAAGLVVHAAAEELGLDLAGCLSRCRLSIAQAFGDAPLPTRSPRVPIAARLRPESDLQRVISEIVGANSREGECPLDGESVAFTGTLTIRRAEAQKAVRGLGGLVTDGPTKDTTLLVVGEQDAQRLAGHELSAKHRKAERMIESGHGMIILGERDFVRWLGARAEG